ncbi:MAG: hypothetical protein LBU66_02195 [Treponema sp.]|jgi:hypothetical protein|nr:hypothetical protein [Treponema sp.]
MRKITLLIALCFLVFSCELFEAQQDPDFWQKLEDEIAWANAAKLTVALSAPAPWGQGSITTAAENRRLGYGFNVDFLPARGFSISEWEAYNTDAIDAYRKENPEWNWLHAVNPREVFKTAGLTPLEGLKLNDNGKDIELLSPNLSGGGTFVFKINVNKRVTLIPWCGNRPAITNINPSMEKEDLVTLSPMATITIDLSSPVDPSTVILREEHIEIRAWGLKANEEPDPEAEIENAAELFTVRWNSGLWRIIIEPNNDSVFQLEKRKITVTLGKRIKNERNESLDVPEDNSFGLSIEKEDDEDDEGNIVEYRKPSFSWKTSALSDTSGIKVESWTAKYDESKSQITIKWDLSEGKTVDTEIGYEINRGGRQNITVTGTSAVIPSVQSLDTNSVRSGQGVRNIQRYDIYIRLKNAGEVVYWDREQITIWNIPGMSFTHNNTATISSKSELEAALIDTTKTNIVLTDSFEVSDWQPRDLTGRNFYGNGHTITIDGFTNTAAVTDRGLFGAVSGTAANPAIIRDLTLVYTDTVTATTVTNVSTTAATNIGAIAGQAKGNTEILNCIVKGGGEEANPALGARIGGTNTQLIRLGGLVGYFEGDGIIENCRAELSVTYLSSGHTGEVCIGGAIGETGEGTGTGDDRSISIDIGTILNIGTTQIPVFVGPEVKLDNRLLLNKATVTANVTANKKSYAGVLNIGGAVGRSGYNTMNDVEYTSGKVSFSKTAATSPGDNYCGGITGQSISTNIIDCHFSGDIGIIPASLGGGVSISGTTEIGGVTGILRTTVRAYFHNCTAHGDFNITSNSNVFIGGVIGRSRSGQRIITNSFFNKGNITVIILGGSSVEAGGFGYLEDNIIAYNCGSKSGTMDITAQGLIWAGGFSSSPGASISYCFSNMDIIVSGTSTRMFQVGGFVGLQASGNISNCYATGSVRVTHNGNSTDPEAIAVGGLVGRSRVEIRNSYALGNVFADKPSGTGTIYAGGLVGAVFFYSSSFTGSVNNCFSAGQVVAQSQTSAAYAGGLVGHRDTAGGNITNSAALGASVTAKAATRGVGRIYGFPASAPSGDPLPINNNYALNTMVIETDNYTAVAPGTRTAAPGLTAPDGANAGSSTFFNPSFWTGLGFVSTGASPPWSFSYLGKDGHPRLAWE